MLIALFIPVTALGLDLLFGELPSRLHPVVFMGRYIGRLKGGRPPGDGASFFFGAALVLSGGLLFGVLAGLLFWLASLAPGPLEILAGAFLLKQSFALRSLLRAGREVEEALRAGDLEEARRLLSFHLVSRDTADLSASEVAGAAIESMAENLTDGVFSPLFYFAFFGIPGAWVYRFVNTCDSMIAYRDREHEYLGKFAACTDTVLNFLPARIAGFALVLAAALLSGRGREALRTMGEQHRRTASPNAGWTMAAAAGALGIVLTKKDSYRLEGGEAEATAESLAQTRRLIVLAAVLLILGPTVLFLGGIRVFFP